MHAFKVNGMHAFTVNGSKTNFHQQTLVLIGNLAESFEGLDLANQQEKQALRTHDQYSNVPRKVKHGKNNPQVINIILVFELI